MSLPTRFLYCRPILVYMTCIDEQGSNFVLAFLGGSCPVTGILVLKKLVQGTKIFTEKIGPLDLFCRQNWSYLENFGPPLVLQFSLQLVHPQSAVSVLQQVH